MTMPPLTEARSAAVIATASRIFGVSEAALVASRGRPYTNAARMACYVALYLACDTSYQAVAVALGRTNSATVCHGIKVARRRMLCDGAYLAAVKQLMAIAYAAREV